MLVLRCVCEPPGGIGRWDYNPLKGARIHVVENGLLELCLATLIL